MKVLSILGSPIRNGNTATLLHMYEKGLVEGQPDSEITEIFLQENKIQGCSGCMSCDLGKIKHCAIKDDMTEIYDLFEEANILVLATPIYFFSMTAQLKAFIDRLYAVPFEKWRGKKIVLLMTYGGDDEEDSGAVNLVHIMEYLANYTKTELAQVYGVSTRMRPDAVAENDKALNDVYELGRRLLTV